MRASRVSNRPMKIFIRLGRVEGIPQFSTKIYKLFLFFIVLSSFWCIHRNTFGESENYEIYEDTISGFLYQVIRRISIKLNDFIVIFLSDPANITLLMICAISRLVMNFVNINVQFTSRSFSVGYSIDESYFKPLKPEVSPVEV